MRSLDSIDGAASNTAYDPSTWDGVNGIAPSKNAVRDQIEALSGAILHTQGAWASGVTYHLNDLVTYAGSTWRGLRDSLAVTPVAGADWELLASAGADASSIIAGPGILATTTDFTTTSYVDVTGVTVAPNTTSPIQLLVVGTVGLISTSGTPTNANYEGLWRVVDDLGAVLEVFEHFAALPSGCPAGTFASTPLGLCIDVTPASTARTYKLQARIAPSATGLAARAYGTGTVPKVRIYARTP